MLQIYFISVLVNILGGIVLAFPILKEQFRFLTIFEDFVNIIQDNKKVRSIFGIISLIVSLFEIIIPYDLPIIGNLLPAISLFLIGFIFRHKIPTIIQNNKEYGKFKYFIENNKKAIGIFALITGIIHFFAAKAPFL